MKQVENTNIKQLKLLVIGTVPPPVGGTTVLLKELIDMLSERQDIDVLVAETHVGRNAGIRRLIQIVNVSIKIFKSVTTVDVVSLHCTTVSLPYLGFFVMIISRFSGRPIIIRKFAGNDYRFKGGLHGLLAEFVLKSVDVYLAETNELVRQALDRGIASVRWYPNSRRFSTGPKESNQIEDTWDGCKKFVYIGHVRAEKGMRVLAEASLKFESSGITVDVYGPWFPDLEPNLFNGMESIRYRGQIPSASVHETLLQYDAFVFPTLAMGEGYPGVIIEAFNASLPVVATKWRVSHEIVDDSVGIIVAPRNAEQLASAMMKLAEDNELYCRLKLNTRKRAERFASETWVGEFVKICKNLAFSTK